MANLTETAFYTRKTVNWIILAIISYIILRLLWSLFLTFWLFINPPKPPPPNQAFGQLPILKFPKIEKPQAQLEFRLETIEGSVPPGPSTAIVYFMPKSNSNFLALPNTQDFAQRLGFNPDPVLEQNSKNIYRFNDPGEPLRRLRYDIVSNNFLMRYDFEKDVGLFLEKNLLSADAMLAEAKSMLQTYNLYEDDLAQGISKVTFLKLQENKLVTTTSLSQADSARVDFFRKPIEKMQVFTPFPDEGEVSIIFSGSVNDKKKILQFAYTFWPINYETTGTYSLKPSSAAWQELQSGGGFIARYPNNGLTAIIRNVYLGYYDSFDPQTYLQPIYVFEGDFGFLAYVSAVSQQWIEDETATQQK